MGSNTKIVVLRQRELIYALIFLVLSLLLIIVAVSIFASGDDTQTSSTGNVYESMYASNSTTDETALYVPGIYSSVVSVGNANMELSVTLDYNHINSISFTNLDESVETLYPLMSPTLDELSSAILAAQSTDDITYSDENRYTSMLLLQAINEAIDKARY